MIHALEQAPFATKLLLAVCALVLLHYWTSRDRATGPLPRLHHPVALLSLAARRLWRNRSLVGIILGLVLVGTLAQYFWLTPMQEGQFRDRPGRLSSQWKFDGKPAYEASGDFRFPIPPRGLFLFSPEKLPGAWAGILDQLPGPELWERLPQPNAEVFFRNIGVMFDLALLALFAWLVALWAKRPTWLAPGLRRRAPGAALLMVAATGLRVLLSYLSLYGITVPAHSPWIANLFYPALTFALVACLTTPLVALAWGLAWQVARGGRWDLRQAVRDALRHWPAVLAVLLGLFLAQIVPFWASLVPLHWLAKLLSVLATVLHVAVFLFFCLPWAIVGDGLSLREALADVVDLWRRHWRDLAIFIPRYTAIMLLAGIPLRLLGEMTQGGLVTGFLSEGVRLLYRLVGALAVVIWYVEARKLRRSRQTGYKEAMGG